MSTCPAVRPAPARRVRASMAVLALAAFSLPVVALVNPNTTHVPLCPLHAFTGLDCPLCGSTRAVYALLHGQWATALHDNALFVLALPLLVVGWWRWDRQVRSGPTVDRLVPRPVLWTVVVTAVVFGIARNLPIGAALAPIG